MINNLDYEINKELGECYLFMGELDKAEEYYLKAAQNNTELAAPYLALGTISLQKGNAEAALGHYTSALDLEKTDKTLSGMGLVQMEMGNAQIAFDLFITALELNPTNSVALNCMVRQAYVLNCVESTIAHLEKCLEISGDEYTQTALAGCLVSLGRTAEAKQHLEQVLASHPESQDAKDLFEHLAA